MAARRFVPITLKVNLLIIASMVIGIGTITFFLASTLFVTIDDVSRRNMASQADAIYAAIESLMLPGEAPLAQGFFQRLNAVDSDQRVHLYRTDGQEAFQDNRTILQVNANQMSHNFPTRETNRQAETVDISMGGFAEALGSEGVPRDVFLQENVDGRVFYRVLKPLINLPKCIECHGADHTIRGIIDIQNDVTETVTLQRTAVLAASGGFFFLVLVLGVGLSRMMGRLILTPVQRIGKVCDGVTMGDFSSRVSVQQSDEIGLLGERVNTMIEGLVERFKLSKYVSGSTIRSLSEGEEGVSVPLTLFFTDIRGFTAYSESHSPDQVVHNLNRILDLQSKIIQEAGGDIDKYVGDEVFAVFDGPESPLVALRAALEIQRQIRVQQADLDGLSIGIGLNFGQVIRGRMGSETRADFTVIGDNVNIASRLCSAAAPGEILASDSYVRELRQVGTGGLAGDLRIVGPYTLKVKGKQAALRVFKFQEGV